MKRITLAFLAAYIFGVTGTQAAPIPVLTLLPANGNLTGVPGSVVGWGFVLTNTASSDWVVLTGSQFTGSQIYGTYEDYLSLSTAPLYVAGPAPESSILEEAWSGASKTPLGVGEFDINSTALTGAAIQGNIVVHYSVFSQDPNDLNFNPDTSTVVADATLSAAAQVNVAPEPSSILTTGTALLLFAFTSKRACHRLPGLSIQFDDLLRRRNHWIILRASRR